MRASKPMQCMQHTAGHMQAHTPERVDAGDERIHAQVKLEAPDQQGPRHIRLRHRGGPGWQRGDRCRDAPPAGAALRQADALALPWGARR